MNPSSSHGGGGAVQTREIVQGNSVNIANAGQAPLTWDSTSGDVLLDRSTLGHPTVVAAGVYAVSVTLQGSSLSAGGLYRATLNLDALGADPNVVGDALAVAADPSPKLSLALTSYIPAGGEINVFVNNVDGAAARNFLLSQAAVQRLS